MPSPVQSYVLEIVALYEHGPVHRACTIKAESAEIAPQSMAALSNVCVLAAPDQSQGKLVSHRSKMAAVRLENGWEWHLPATYIVPR
jgi:hypothetical protein